MQNLLVTCLLAALLVACARPVPTGGALSSVDDRRPTSTPQHTSSSEPIATMQTPREASDTQPRVIAARMPRVEPGDAGQMGPLVGGLNGFAFDLYRAALEGEDGNLIYSPYSIALAFSMVYAGARDDTEAQMADVLGFLPQEGHHPAANALEHHLASLGADAPQVSEEQGEPFELRGANAVWGQREFPFEAAYLETLAEHYGAGVRTVDFAADPEAARRAVNSWVEDQTKGRIPDILPQGAIDQLTRLVLANAIYFKAGWLYPFEEGGTQDSSFTLLDGKEVTVPMMRQNVEAVPYAEGDGYQAVVLPYVGGTTEMMVIAPEAGRFTEVEAALSTDFLKRVRARADRNSATVSMPRFEVESELDLVSLLPGMGMPDAFEPGTADFSGIVKGIDLFISAAIHRATVSVDEEGTEATAATVVVVSEASASVEPPPHVTVDRPFIFAIVERETGAILFLGRVTNPVG